MIISSPKYNRTYQLLIQTDETLLQIALPFTIEIDITRSTLGSANSCKLRIYNLAQGTRDFLYFNVFNTGVYKQIQLQAGYGDNLAVVFAGNVQQCWSVREGVNFITQIECYDGGFAYVNCQAKLTFPAGTAMTDVIKGVMQALTVTPGGLSTGISVGAIGNFEGSLPKDTTYSGNPQDILFEITGGAFFIDKQIAYALKDNEYVALQAASTQPALVVNDQSGLLNTPVLMQTTARFEMLFEPTLHIGSLIQVDSSTFPKLNGSYKVTSVKHHGVISPVVSGDLITVGEFFYTKTPEAIEAEGVG